MVLDALLLCVLLMLPVWPARRFAETLFPEAEPLRVFFVAVWCYILTIHGEMMLLGLMGLIRLPWALAFGALMVGVAWWLPAAARPLSPGAALRDWFAGATPHLRVGAVVLAIPTLYCFGRLAYLGPFFMWDDWAYHGPAVSGMMHSHSTRFFRHNMAMYYPFNPHLLNLYTTLATGTIAWTWMATTLWIFVASMAWATLSLHVPQRGRDLFLLAGGVFGMSFEPRWFENAFCSADLVVAIALLSAFALARPRAGAGDREIRWNALFCGLVVGYAVGTKHFYMVPSVCAALTCLYWSTWGRVPGFATKRAAWSMAGQVFGLGFLGVFLSGSYWYLYNIALTGNPLYPLKFAGLPGTLKSSNFRTTKLIHFGQEAHWSADFWRNVWSQWVNWPFYMGVMMTVGLVAGVVVCAVLAWGWWRRRPATAAWPAGVMPGMLAAAFLLIAAYPFLPYSGTYNVTEHLIISRRFMLFCLLAALAFWAHAGGWVVRGRTPLATAVRVMFVFLLINSWPFIRLDTMILPDATWNLRNWFYYVWDRMATDTPPFPWDYAGCASAVVLVLGAVVARWAPGAMLRLSALGRLKMPMFGGLALLIVAVGAIRPIYHPGPYNTRVQSWDGGMMPGVWALEYLPDGARVGSLSQTAWEVWWIFGSRGQFEPVFLHDNGMAIDELHTMQTKGLVDHNDPDKLPRLGLPWTLEKFPKPELFAERLRAARLDYVFCTKYLPGYPHTQQRDAMRQLPDFVMIYDDGFNEIYQHVESPDEPLTKIPAPAKSE